MPTKILLVDTYSCSCSYIVVESSFKILTATKKDAETPERSGIYLFLFPPMSCKERFFEPRKLFQNVKKTLEADALNSLNVL